MRERHPVHAPGQEHAHVRRQYERPALIEYGSIGRLTRSGGSSAMEGPTPLMAASMAMGMCL